MNKRNIKKSLTLLLTLAMIVSLFCGLTITAQAISGNWTDAGNYNIADWYTGHSSPFTIDTAAELAGLAYLVNTGTDNFSGDIVNLTEDIDLSAHYWVPIGGASTMSGGVPTGYYFAGRFDGYYASHVTTYNTHIITGMQINTAPTNYGGYGLFGYVNGGIIQNVTIQPASASDPGIALTNNVSAVGGFAGYTNGTLYNLHNLGVTVNVSNTGSSQTGGIAGTVENNSETAILVQYCSNEGNITGRGRVGGIVGAVYCSNVGGVVVDNCFNRSNTLKTIGTAQNSFSGSIVGYCRGYITNSYSFNTHVDTNGSHYVAGIVGLLQGTGPQASLSNSYSYASFGTTAYPVNPAYDRFAFTSVDNSNTMPIANTLWKDTNPQPGSVTLTQPNATGTNGWGLWTQVGTLTGTDTTSVYTTSTGTTTTPAALTVLNGTSTIVSSALVSKPNSYTAVSSLNAGYPSLVWEQNPSFSQNPGGGGPTNTDDTTMIFLNGTALVNGDGSQANPYNNLSSALSALTASRNVIYVVGTVTLSANTYS